MKGDEKKGENTFFSRNLYKYAYFSPNQLTITIYKIATKKAEQFTPHYNKFHLGHKYKSRRGRCKNMNF